MSSRALLAGVMLLGWTLSAAAQAPSRRPRTLAGVCGAANWVCVAECIDSACVDQCLREGCETALDKLQGCTAKAGCAPEDTSCPTRSCGQVCQKAFEPAPPSPEKEQQDPCTAIGTQGAPVPKEVLGRWELSAATLKPEPPGTPARADPQPRPDFVRSLEVRPGGCFLLSTQLKDATLGRGNQLEVRAWGLFAVSGDDHVTLQAKDGQASGPVCGKPRVIPLSKGKFRGPRYTFQVEKDTLTLTVDDASQRTFQFQRVETGAPPKE
ncbi:hypothetical protein POL68_33695 [Stigmatella sp. ncwal1]|uniref:Uncharacterized protein n=1 Tax=Stigmatella ashevillensis TaxID=2995309 RepID=A0ABT5DIJ1_9BACT|nr:hypothetical protein [Stigmatella ashevillena]MDC0713467.1 hypothetical protein [Stigmatella ashevillena]